MLRSMLTPDREARLGVGVGGIQRIKSHEFFDGLDWERVLAKADAGPLPMGRLTVGETAEKWSPRPAARAQAEMVSEVRRRHHVDQSYDPTSE